MLEQLSWIRHDQRRSAPIFQISDMTRQGYKANRNDPPGRRALPGAFLCHSAICCVLAGNCCCSLLRDRAGLF